MQAQMEQIQAMQTEMGRLNQEIQDAKDMRTQVQGMFDDGLIKQNPTG